MVRLRIYGKKKQAYSFYLMFRAEKKIDVGIYAGAMCAHNYNIT